MKNNRFDPLFLNKRMFNKTLREVTGFLWRVEDFGERKMCHVDTASARSLLSSKLHSSDKKHDGSVAV